MLELVVNSQINESRLLIIIESTIQKWVKENRMPYRFYQVFSELLFDFYKIYCLDYKYFGYINAFCQLVYEYDLAGIEQAELLEKLESNSFKYYQQYLRDFRLMQSRSLRDHAQGEKKNMVTLQQRMDTALHKYSKLLVVRVDLAYLADKQFNISINDFQKDISYLRQLIHNRDTIFKECIDYAWALEQGEEKGYHCHLLLVFNGHKRRSAWKIAQDVGDRWRKFTDGSGYFFNCHTTEQIRSYEEKGILGIGMIHRENGKEVRNMLNAVQYLVRPEKEDQHLRVKVTSKMRTFG